MVDGVVAADPAVLNAVLAEVGRLERLAGDLSTLSHADEGRLVMADALVDLRDVAATVVDSFQPLAVDKHITLRLAGAGASVRGDHDRLVQVLANLVANALTYTPAEGHVTLDVVARGSNAIVTVTDTGVGLAAADVERVFERFYRVRGAERPPGGSGIGLAIARAIARAHGGELTATSLGLGHGTTFTLRLPAVTEPAVA
jgi:histidine kinase